MNLFTMEKYYTGIGSRNCPQEILDYFSFLGGKLEGIGYTLRSGGAGGADLAFEKNILEKKHIFLPWKGFNDSTSDLYHICDKALALAENNHPAWDRCSRGARSLHARNGYQILGKELDNPSKFLLCWTPNGEVIGGTGQALRLAQKHGIKIFNFGKGDRVRKEFNQYINS